MIARHLLFVTLCAVCGACAGPDEKKREQDDDTPPVVVTNPDSKNALKVENLTLEPDAQGSSQVRIKRVVADAPGFVVVYDSKDGKPTTILGHAPVPQGATEDLGVPLSEEVPRGQTQTLFVLLHRDAPEPDGVFTFDTPQGGDPPALDAQGQLVAATLTVTQAVGALEIGDQTLERVSTQVVVTNVSLKMPGFVALFADQEEGAAEFLGKQWLPAGLHPEVKITTVRPLIDDETLRASLHADLPMDGAFTFGPKSQDDPELLDDLGDPIQSSFTVTLPAGLPAARITLGAKGTTGYLVTAIEPQGLPGLPPPDPEAEDPTFTLVPGWRYTFENTMPSEHPVEFGAIMPAGDPVQDAIALSQGQAMGSLEADGSVAWVERDAEVSFTLSPSLQEVLTGYRCATHQATMRGQLAR